MSATNTQLGKVARVVRSVYTIEPDDFADVAATRKAHRANLAALLADALDLDTPAQREAFLAACADASASHRLASPVRRSNRG